MNAVSDTATVEVAPVVSSTDKYSMNGMGIHIGERKIEGNESTGRPAHTILLQIQTTDDGVIRTFHLSANEDDEYFGNERMIYRGYDPMDALDAAHKSMEQAEAEGYVNTVHPSTLEREFSSNYMFGPGREYGERTLMARMRRLSEDAHEQHQARINAREKRIADRRAYIIGQLFTDPRLFVSEDQR